MMESSDPPSSFLLPTGLQIRQDEDGMYGSVAITTGH